MKTANQLTFTTYEASLKIKPDDPIKIIFDNIDWSFVHALVKDKYSSSPKGADGYDPVSLLKAQLLVYLGEVSSDRKLVSALRFNARFCLLCGFSFFKTPSNGTFTVFRNRLGEDLFYEILHQLIAQAIILKVINGGDTAIDSTHLWAYSNKSGRKTCSCKGKCKCPKSYSDKDATWGFKSKDYAFLGYKVHLIVDAHSQLPLDAIVTPGNEPDSPQAKPLLKNTSEKHPENPITTVSMDASYDAHENYRFIIQDINAAPIIALNPRKGPDLLSTGALSLSPEGKYTCSAGYEVVYWGKESNGRLKFRCPAAVGKCQCLFRYACSPSDYGKVFHLFQNRDDRLIGPIPRGTELWKKKYSLRTSVERAYSEEKGSHQLAALRVRGLAKVKIHTYLALCGQILKRIGVVMKDKPKPLLYPATL